MFLDDTKRLKDIEHKFFLAESSALLEDNRLAAPRLTSSTLGQLKDDVEDHEPQIKEWESKGYVNLGIDELSGMKLLWAVLRQQFRLIIPEINMDFIWNTSSVIDINGYKVSVTRSTSTGRYASAYVIMVNKAKNSVKMIGISKNIGINL